MTRTPRTQICRNCDERRDASSCFLATRKSGGNYQRGNRNYRSRICYECAYKLVAGATPGHDLNERWVLSSLLLVIDKPSKVEDQSQNGIKVMKYTWPNGSTTVIADCQCFGNHGRVHSWWWCPIRKNNPNREKMA